MSGNLEQLLEYCRAEERVCPQPQQWNRFFQTLPAVRRIGVGFEPAAPLILAAWWESSDDEKKQRLELHVRWADKHGALEKIDEFLRGLPESESSC